MKDTQELKRLIGLSNHKKDSPLLSASIAVSKYGHRYSGFALKSKTNLMSIPSEQSALMSAIQAGDTNIVKLKSYYPNFSNSIEPRILGIIADFQRRANVVVEYSQVDKSGNDKFVVKDTEDFIPYYANSSLDTIKIKSPELSKSPRLHELCVAGTKLAFTTHRKASRYGAAVKTKKHYISGQYSSFDQASNIHAEIGAVMAAIIAGDTNIKQIAVVSEKFTSEPTHMCGACRQFIAELGQFYGFSPQIKVFSLDGKKHKEYNLEEYLPNLWSVS